MPGVFPASELDAIDREIDRLLEAPGNDAGGIHPTWIFQVARRSEMARRDRAECPHAIPDRTARQPSGGGPGAHPAPPQRQGVARRP